MNTLKITVQDAVAIISLDHGNSNAINGEMIIDLKKIFKNIEADETVRGVILTGKHGFFSSGLDLIELYDYNEEQIKDFWVQFLDLVKSLALFKKPLISAISGHSPAGGCVLAVCSDYRVMAQGKYIIGLNEVPVGIIVPNSIFELYAFWIGKRKAYQNLLEGKLMGADEALSIGLIDEVAPIESLMTVALNKMKTYISFDSTTWQESKSNLRQDLIASLSVDQTPSLEKMLKQWWAPSTRSVLNTIIKNLQAKKK